MPDNFCLLADITAAHGVHGALRVRVHSDHPDRFSVVQTVYIGTSELDLRPVKVLASSQTGDMAVLTLEGITTREGAEAVRNCHLYIDADSMLPPPEGRYFIHDLIGCLMKTRSGREIGVVEDVLLLPVNDLYVVRKGGEEYLIPAIPDVIVEVRIADKQILIEDIPGLVESNDEN